MRKQAALLAAVLLLAALPTIPAGAASESAVRWGSFSESSACGSPYVGMPIMSRSGGLGDGESILGPIGTNFGRSVGAVRDELVWWTVPMSSGRRVQVHSQALPAFERVAENLAAEQASGNYYSVTSAAAFVPRTVGGQRQLSRHSLGIAIDINPAQNPYSSDPDRLITNMPDWFIEAWRAAGFCWGGDWVTAKDAMHFAWMGPSAGTGSVSLRDPIGSETDYREALRIAVPSLDGHVDFTDAGGFGALDIVRVVARGSDSIIDVVSSRSGFQACSHYRWLLPRSVESSATTAWGDIDGDSRVDFVHIEPDGTLVVSTRASGFEEVDTVGSGFGNAVAAAIGDVDGDGRGDLLAADMGGNVRAWAAPSFEEEIEALSVGSTPDSLEVGDRNGDGAVEIYVVDESVVTVLTKDTSGDWVIDHTLDLGSEARALGVADVDGDGRADVASLTEGDEYVAHVGNSSTGRAADSWWVNPTYDCPDNPIPLSWEGTFYDDDTSVFAGDIEWVAEVDVTRGCNPPFNDRFCTGDVVTRGQMAAFLVRALGLSASATDYFADDEESIFEDDINALAQAGITRGCSDESFCPEDSVTRGQMAAFLARGFALPPTNGDDFADDETSVFEGDIQRLVNAGITRGCNPPENTRFCPEDPVTRGQMAAFIRRSLN